MYVIFYLDNTKIPAIFIRVIDEVNPRWKWELPSEGCDAKFSGVLDICV